MQIDHSAGHPYVEIVPPSPDIAGLQPLKTIKSRWPAIIGALVTIAMLAGLGHELFNSGLAGLNRATPRNPLFYAAFAGLYLVPPLADYLTVNISSPNTPGLRALQDKSALGELLAAVMTPSVVVPQVFSAS